MQRSNTPDLKWDDVRLFLALCGSHKLSQAGKRLGMDASTVSRRLNALEEALATTLFDRGRDGITPTDAARNLEPIAEEMARVAARFSGEVDRLERDVSGEVCLAAPVDAAQVLLTPLLPALFSRHPQLRVELLTGERVVDLTRREADLAIRTARPTSGDLVFTRLVQVRWVVATSPALVEGAEPTRNWSDLPWLGCGRRTLDATPGRWFSKHVGGVEPVLRADSITTQIACIQAGLGVALLPDRTVSSFGLVPVRITKALQRETSFPVDELFLVTSRALRRVPRINAVWDFLIEHVTE